MVVITERAADAARRRRQREKNRTVEIPPCEDRRRRRRLESDDEAWLAYYFAPESETRAPFTYAFTEQQRIMIQAISHAIRQGGDQAIAATRGEGKTTYFERMLLKATLCGTIGFSVLFAASGAAAENSIDSIKSEVEINVRLAADYPEVCVPVRALENTPNRAHFQLVVGRRHDNGKKFPPTSSKFSWCGNEIVFPNVPGSPSAGAVIATRGLDSAVRGLKKNGRRVDLAGIDDPDTEDTARSEDQAKKLERRIDRAIGGLGGQKRRVARVMLTTLQSRTSVSYKYTDPAQKPSWNGKRFRFLVKPPERIDLWEEYVHIKQQDWQNETAKANEFYAANRRKMDAGAEVANPNRFTDGELSALQFYFNEVARLGPEAVATEYDNDPPEEAGPIESGITPHRIQKQLNGYPRRLIPPGCVKLTRGIDCRKVALHWVVRAWRPDGTGFTIDYGVHEVLGTIYGSDEGLDVALKRAILSFLEESKGYDYAMIDGGEIKSIDRTLIDAGWRDDAVYSACLEAGSLGIFPVKGFGKSSGCVRVNFSEVQRRTPDRKPGDHWFLSRQGRLWLVCADADHWKAWEHDRWMTSPAKPGCMTLFGESSEPGGRLSDDEKAHHSYARHLCNEVEVEEVVKGKLKRYWKEKSSNTHFLDASYYSDVAANMEGIKVIAGASKVAASNMASASGHRPIAAPATVRPASAAVSTPPAKPSPAAGGRLSLGQMAKRK